MDTKAYWVGFNLVKGIGAVRLRAILEYFGDLETAWSAPLSAFAEVGLPANVLENLNQIRHDIKLEKVWEKIQSQGIQVKTWEDDDYPRRLREIDNAPPVLYLRGCVDVRDEWGIAVVGTRQVTAYGRQVAEELASFLARNGVTIVSGLARGVDAISHQAALRAGGRTLAVLGSGIDIIYPPEHRRLAEEIVHQGALLSDYSPGTIPDSINFPPRNRIISGLSVAVVIVEAGERSGALITATFAAEQGRDVFAVPGTIYALQSKGTNRLIQQGARPLLRVQDVLDVLNLQQVQEYKAARLTFPVDAIEAALLEILGSEPLYIDEIQNRSGLSIDKVSATLAMMELKGLVHQVGGMNYTAIREAGSEYQGRLNE
ncbi:MAG: DNA-protecting protein DprA [Anaerolineae bacterium]|nr:DNA-protecting protein DprA [Anaerolineae bacterium]